MRLITQIGPTCLVTSAAMILDVEPAVLHQEIGTTGEEIWWHPDRKRGVHIQEIQDCFLTRGRCLYPVELNPHLHSGYDEDAPKSINHNPESRWNRLINSIKNHRAILIVSAKDIPFHAVAWDGKSVYDPRGFMKSIESYMISEAWIMGSITW